MGGVIDMEKARGIVGNTVLWPRVRDFLWDFAPQVHESWLEGLSGLETLDASREGDSSLAPCLVSSPRTKSFLLSSLGVEPCFHDFPKDDGSRLLLPDGATLEKIVQWLGALACAEELRRVTDGATVRALKAALPGVYPDVFGYTAYFDFGADFSHAETRIPQPKAVREADARAGVSAQSVSEEGCKMFFSVLSKLPGPLIRRMNLKFPKDLCDRCLSAPLREAKIKYTVILKLLKLKFPEAYSLCCS